MRRPLVAALAAGAVLTLGSVALAAESTYLAHLKGRNEVPVRDTKAAGNAVFHLSEDGTELSYKLIVANIDNVVQAHIHLGPAGANGPIVAFLYGLVPPGGGRENGVLATGTITAANLINTLAGQPLSALVAEINAGNAYVNVHTNDGVDPTNSGPGDFGRRDPWPDRLTATAPTLPQDLPRSAIEAEDLAAKNITDQLIGRGQRHPNLARGPDRRATACEWQPPRRARPPPLPPVRPRCTTRPIIPAGAGGQAAHDFRRGRAPVRRSTSPAAATTMPTTRRGYDGHPSG